MSPSKVTPVPQDNKMTEPNVQYEEISRYTDCPTCQGTGKISKDSEAEYIALIPLTDRRLKPHRTTLKVIISILVCLLLFGLLLFFLLPRSVRLSSEGPVINPYFVAINPKTGRIFIAMNNELNLTNQNFYPLNVASVRVEVSIQNLKLVPVVTSKEIKVPLRATRSVLFSVNVTLEGSDFRGFSDVCLFPQELIHRIYMHFTVTVIASSMSQSVEATLVTYQRVNCFPTTNVTLEDREHSQLFYKPGVAGK